MDRDHYMMGLALEEAQRALDVGHFPVGAVLALGDDIIGRGRKTMGSNHLDHAEMNLFRTVFTGPYSFSRGDPITLYTTLEPCIMCWGTARHLPIARLAYAMPDAYGGCSAVVLGAPPPRHRERPLEIVADLRREEARALFLQFLDRTDEPFWTGGGAPDFVAEVRAGRQA